MKRGWIAAVLVLGACAGTSEGAQVADQMFDENPDDTAAVCDRVASASSNRDDFAGLLDAMPAEERSETVQSVRDLAGVDAVPTEVADWGWAEVRDWYLAVYDRC